MNMPLPEVWQGVTQHYDEVLRPNLHLRKESEPESYPPKSFNPLSQFNRE